MFNFVDWFLNKINLAGDYYGEDEDYEADYDIPEAWEEEREEVADYSPRTNAVKKKTARTRTQENRKVEEEFVENKTPVNRSAFSRRDTVTRHDRPEILYKQVEDIPDAMTVIDEYQRGVVCVVQFSMASSDPQGTLNYLAGAMYALDGKMEQVDRTTFIVAPKNTVYRMDW